MLFLLETDIENFDMRTYASFIPIVPRVSPGRKIRIVLLVRPNLIKNITVCTHLMEENVPTVWIDYKSMNMRTVVGGIYREWRNGDHKGDIQSQRERLLVILDQIRSATNKPGVKTVVLGDWNLDMNRRKDKSYSLRGLFDLVDTVVETTGLVSKQLGNTFIGQRQTKIGLKQIESAIDYVYHSKDMLVNCGTINNGMSDHLPIIANISKTVNGKQKTLKACKRTVWRRCYGNINWDGFRADLINHQWECLAETDNIDQMVLSFEEFINKSLDCHAPVRELHIPIRYKHGLSDETKACIWERNEARRKLKGINGKKETKLWQNYKRTRNKCVSLVRRDTRKFTMELITGNDGRIDVWKAVKAMSGKKNNTKIRLKMNDGRETEEEDKIANTFNEFFVKKIQDLRGSICESNRINPLTHLCKTSDRELFTLKTVAETQVLAQIKKLNDTHSVGIDGIQTFVIKSFQPRLSVLNPTF